MPQPVRKTGSRALFVLALAGAFFAVGCSDGGSGRGRGKENAVAGNGAIAGTDGTAGSGGTAGIVSGDAGFEAPTCMSGAGTGAAASFVDLGGSAATAKPKPLEGDTIIAPDPPPAISGGTLLLMQGAKLLVASDPDRDQLYLIDPIERVKLKTIKLQAGDEPGRLVETTDGQVFVVLRGAGSIARLDTKSGEVSRIAVCELPRGIAFDAASDTLHVACAEGKLLSLSATTEAVTRTLELGRDLRDVVVQDGELYVSRFRSSELLHVAADGVMKSKYTPPVMQSTETVFEQIDACGNGNSTTHVTAATASVAWRTLAIPGHGVAMLHQRSRTDEISVTQGGYGGGTCDSGIVQTALTIGADKGDGLVYPPLASMTLTVDLAGDPSGANVAIVAAGNWGTTNQISVFALTNLQSVPQAQPVAAGEAATGAGTGSEPSEGGAGSGAASNAAPLVDPVPMMPDCSFPTVTLDTQGQATALVYVSNTVLAVQTREPAALELFDVSTRTQLANITLDTSSRMDTGHSMFHLRAGAGVACASCHAEGGDDGHVWKFPNVGARRTQHLRGGILGTEPLHWDGDMKTFSQLMTDVFVGRMSGFSPTPAQETAISSWIDKQPAFHAAASDATAADRGRALFESKATGCTTCHSGDHLTNNQSVDVGTGVKLQVPSLHGVSFRAPFMHDGCAATLKDRFGKCGGGDAHGHTSQLSPDEIDDLVAYLETL